MTKRRQKRNKFTAQQREGALWDHIWQLGLGNPRNYAKWCTARGFGANTKKSPLNFRQELAHHKKEMADKHLLNSRVSRNPMEIIVAVCNGTTEPLEIESVPLREVCLRIANSRLRKKEWPDLGEFLARLWKHSKLPIEHEQHGGLQLFYVDALINIYRRRRSWIRPVSRWKPKTHSREKQFSSLLQHLLLSYKVPEFFESIWFRNDKQAINHQKWCVNIGSGQSIRKGPSPVPLTKKIAHHFSKAPRSCSVEQAIRYAQVQSLGGSHALCRAVIETQLGAEFKNELFWQSVIEFFVVNEGLDVSQVGPIVDFLQHHKFENQELRLENGATRTLLPPQPNLSMRNRSLPSLQSQVDEWHERLGKAKADATLRWNASAINPATYVKGKDEKQLIWRIEELLSQKELAREGRALKHCVASYARHCLSGRASIWSLTREDAFGNVRRRQTIEVAGQKRIVQCRGLANKLPTEQELNIVSLWASTESLEVCVRSS